MPTGGRVEPAFTYRWDAAQTDTDLVPAAGDNQVLDIEDGQPPGGRRGQMWRFADRAARLR